MLPHHVSLHVLRVDVEVLGEEEPEPGHVKVGAGSDDAVDREPRQLPRHVRQDVDGVGDDEQDGVRRVLRQRRHDLPEERDVPVQQVEPGLPGDLARAGGDDGEVGAPGDGQIRVGDEARARQERRRVLQVQHLAAELVRERVHKRDLVGEAARWPCPRCRRR